MKRIAIIGASHAGVSCADKLRQYGFKGALILIDRLPGLPVQRPPLSKKLFQSDDADFEAFYLRSKEFFTQENIELRTDSNVTSIDQKTKSISLENGEDITYDILILAMGADAKRPDFVSKQASNIHVLRDTQDALKLRETALNSDKAVIIGGGFIGLEVASSMRMAGLVVDLVEFEPRLLARVSSPQISEFFRLLHNKQGVSFHLGKAVTDIIYSETGQARSVKLSSGEILECDVLVFGIGVAPNINLAKSLGLCVADGVTVDNTYLASDDIYVIGDLAFSKKRSNIRTESVYHAQFSAAVAAASITGSNMPEQEAFWFWSDQYDVKLQIAGVLPKISEAQQIHKEVRSGKKEGSFSVWSWFQDKLVCIEAIGDPQSYMIGKRLLEQDTDISPEMIADETVSLKQLFEKFVANAR